MQRNLFEQARSPLRLTAEAGRSEPRLWVRRLLIWQDGDTVLREVKLRPGLNIVWSPDAGGGDQPIGHGGGKTTLCRLLRYGLGEAGFAPRPQARRTSLRLLKGRIGLEARVDGRDWSIVRGFSGVHEDWALPDAPLAYAPDVAPTGMDPFRAAVTATLLAPIMHLVPPRIGEENFWSVVLAWLTRDQECRFSHLLDWRDKDSDSGSPVRNLSADDRLTVVRATVGVLRPEELATKAAHEAALEKVARSERSLERRTWQAQTYRSDLAQALGLDPQQPPSQLDAEVLRKAALEKWTALTGSPAPTTPEMLDAVRAALEGCEAELRRAGEALAGHQATRSVEERVAKELADELPELTARAQTVPLCPVCHVPIDRARAEGCGISLAPCDLEAVRAKARRSEEAYDAATKKVADLTRQTSGLQHALRQAEQKRDRQREHFARLTKDASQRTARTRSAERLVEDATRLARLVAERDGVAESIKSYSTERDELKKVLDQHRAAAQELLDTVSTFYDGLLKSLVPGDVQGRVTLDGNGLHLIVQLGGDRSTAAIESLKVVILDLAVLALTIEGRTRLPGLLIHDSPREADLGLSIYQELFPLLARFEAVGPAPLFQYVVTTTTAPPEAFRKEPWLRLELHGAPAAARLLGMDL